MHIYIWRLSTEKIYNSLYVIYEQWRPKDEQIAQVHCLSVRHLVRQWNELVQFGINIEIRKYRTISGKYNTLSNGKVHLMLCVIIEGPIHRDFRNWVRAFPITKTYLYNFDPLKPHFYIVKLGFTGVYIIFLISAQNIDCGYSLEPPRSNEYAQSMFCAETWKISEFLSENFQFLEMKFSINLNRRGFVMRSALQFCFVCRILKKYLITLSRETVKGDKSHLMTKTNKMACVPCEDSGHPLSLIGRFAVRSVGSY